MPVYDSMSRIHEWGHSSPSWTKLAAIGFRST
jgi:hypothetical protein